MTLQVFNTLTRQKEEFVPLEPGKVKMYVCGPTVYNYFHIGNARVFIVFDVFRRYLQYRGYEVTYVQNFTDIDDKMIKRANEMGITVKELGDRFIAEYFQDADTLGIRRADIHPRATEHIPEIIALIERLIERGHAYVVEGDVYFDTGSFPTYGKLSHQKLDELAAGARVDVDERKRNPMDFALWKSQKPGEPAWQSPWGMGRPGWHIECSAMSQKYLGRTIDIHAGGPDLIFPHHENEIAQSEAAYGVPFARYWLHIGFINVNNEKMSKSLGNFFTVRDILKVYDPETVRFFILSSHYKSPINFSDDLLTAAQSALDRLYNTLHRVEHVLATNSPASAAADLPAGWADYQNRFITAMDNDFNTADAIAVLFDFARDLNITADELVRGGEGTISATALAKGKDLWLSMADVLGLLSSRQEENLAEEIEKLIEERQQARKARNWARADEIRDRLTAMGIILEDTPQGVRWRRK